MKRVVSVSLGTSRRDHRASIQILGEDVEVERVGMDGDLERARLAIQTLDGQVDAIGLGGIDRYLVADQTRYEIRDARRLAEAASRTPVVDGSGLKDTWERWIVEDWIANGVLLPTMSVLMVSALDRFGMAETFYRHGFSVLAGDLIFGSHINYPIESLAELIELGKKLLPEMVKLPFSQLYPTGDLQITAPDDRYYEYFLDADVIAGDFHFIRRHAPTRLEQKVIVTNTTTALDREEFMSRGVRQIITTTPVIAGRTFGTNVMEAALVAVTGILPEEEAWPDIVRKARRQLSREQK